jgi:transposase InsO family protein
MPRPRKYPEELLERGARLVFNPDAQRRPDLVNRRFVAEAPDRCWVADFTYVRCWEGMTYFGRVRAGRL